MTINSDNIVQISSVIQDTCMDIYNYYVSQCCTVHNTINFNNEGINRTIEFRSDQAPTSWIEPKEEPVPGTSCPTPPGDRLRTGVTRWKETVPEMRPAIVESAKPTDLSMCLKTRQTCINEDLLAVNEKAVLGVRYWEKKLLWPGIADTENEVTNAGNTLTLVKILWRFGLSQASQADFNYLFYSKTLIVNRC